MIQLISGHTTDLLNFGMISEGLILVAFFVLNIIFEFDLCLIKKPSFPSTGSQELNKTDSKRRKQKRKRNPFTK